MRPSLAEVLAVNPIDIIRHCFYSHHWQSSEELLSSDRTIILVSVFVSVYKI